jgi:hypothetical protein
MSITADSSGVHYDLDDPSVCGLDGGHDDFDICDVLDDNDVHDGLDDKEIRPRRMWCRWLLWLA